MFTLSGDEESNWRKNAECYVRRDEVQAINQLLGYDMFYPETGKGAEALKWSKKFCRPCTKKTECYVAGLKEQGTWGDATERERRRQVLSQNTVLSTILGRLGVQSQDENTHPIEELNHGPAA